MGRIEAVNKQNLALLDELTALDFVGHTLQLRVWKVTKKLNTIIFKGFVTALTYISAIYISIE